MLLPAGYIRCMELKTNKGCARYPNGARYPSARVDIDQPCVLGDADIWGLHEPLDIHGPLLTSYLEAFGAYYWDNIPYIRRRLSWFANSTAIRFGDGIGGPTIERPVDSRSEKRHHRQGLAAKTQSNVSTSSPDAAGFSSKPAAITASAYRVVEAPGALLAYYRLASPSSP